MGDNILMYIITIVLILAYTFGLLYSIGKSYKDLSNETPKEKR
jgi:hypothetical protein